MSREAAIVQINADIAAEEANTPRDETKIARLKKARGELAAAELASRKKAVTPAAPPEHPGPLYPVGTTANFGGRSATVKQAWYDLGRWHYTVAIATGTIFGTITQSTDEEKVKQVLAKELGQKPGPAYPPGLTVMRNGKGGTVEAVSDDGKAYLKGWPQPISERELADLLARA